MQGQGTFFRFSTHHNVYEIIKVQRKYYNYNKCEKVISHPDLIIKILSGNNNKNNFQVSAARMGVCAYMGSIISVFTLLRILSNIEFTEKGVAVVQSAHP